MDTNILELMSTTTASNANFNNTAKSASTHSTKNNNHHHRYNHKENTNRTPLNMHLNGVQLNENKLENEFDSESILFRNSFKSKEKQFYNKPRYVGLIFGSEKKNKANNSSNNSSTVTPNILPRKSNPFENSTTESRSSITRTIFSTSRQTKVNVNEIKSIDPILSTQTIQINSRKAAKTPNRAPLRNLLDSGDSPSIHPHMDKLNAYIVSENYQERLIVLSERSQQPYKQKDLYNKFKAKRSTSFNRRVPLTSSNPTSNGNFLFTHQYKA